MELVKSLSGMVRLRIISADPAMTLTAIGSAGIEIFQADRKDDDIVLNLVIRRQDVRQLLRICSKKGWDVQFLGKSGIYWTVMNLIKRPVLMICMMLLLFLSLWLPSRVLFFRVEGAESIPERLILEKCREIGMDFGASRRDVRSEKMKNALLAAIPELQWAGINTSGCVATVSVRERSAAQMPEKPQGVGSIVAIRDGIVTQSTATKGTLLCKPGDAVVAGQVLISGYTDCGLSILATRAEGEIYARTERELTLVSPSRALEKRDIQVVEKKYSLIIGKNRINFYKGSGISPPGCAKMYSEKILTLPGGFQLPVVLVTETWISYEPASIISDSTNLSDHALRYIREQMTAGAVLLRREELSEEKEVYTFTGKYACTELIGRLQYEEIIKPNG